MARISQSRLIIEENRKGFLYPDSNRIIDLVRIIKIYYSKSVSLIGTYHIIQDEYWIILKDNITKSLCHFGFNRYKNMMSFRIIVIPEKIEQTDLKKMFTLDANLRMEKRMRLGLKRLYNK